jgi:hypothetical protein
MRQFLHGIAAFVFLFCISVGTAKADGNQELNYVLTGPASDPICVTFILPVNPTIAPGNVDPDGTFFMVAPIDMTVNGISNPGDMLAIYNLSGQGWLADEDGFFSLMNPPDVNNVLFSGDLATPTMSVIPSAIPLEDFFSQLPGYTLTATPVLAPEPGSLLLVAAGLLPLFLMRRRGSVPE